MQVLFFEALTSHSRHCVQ